MMQTLIAWLHNIDGVALEVFLIIVSILYVITNIYDKVDDAVQRKVSLRYHKTVSDALEQMVQIMRLYLPWVYDQLSDQEKELIDAVIPSRRSLKLKEQAVFDEQKAVKEKNMRFPLDRRVVGGYKFGDRTWYTAFLKKHLGVDYKAKNDTLYAPCNGEIVNEFYGFQGGNTIWFKPDGVILNGRPVIMRFLHLASFSRGKGRVNEGDTIAITGNSGSSKFSTGPHLHLDIHNNPDLLIKKGDLSFEHFIDPESFDWNNLPNLTPAPQPTPPAPAPTPPPAAPSPYPRIVTVTNPKGVYVRTEPNSGAALAGSKFLSAGTKFEAAGVVDGQDPYNDGRNKWYHSKKGNYVWAGACN